MTIAAILKRLYQAPRNRVHQNSSHKPLLSALICLLVALAFSSAYGQAPRAQQKAAEPGRAVVSPTIPPSGPIDRDRYVVEGYTVIGPVKLVSVSSQSLVLPGLHELKGPEISLLNKAVVVLDSAGNALKFGALGKGVSVLICDRKDRIVIYLVSAAKGRSSHVH